MNGQLDLTKILDGCPQGTKLYSAFFGEVEFDRVKNADEITLGVTLDDGERRLFTVDGRYDFDYKGDECFLFPSKEQRD